MNELANLLDDNFGYTSEVPAKELAERILNAGYAKVVRCRDYKYAPSGTDGHDLEWPYTNEDGYDVNPCPLKCIDSWYSKNPKPDFFCAYGEREMENEN